MEKGTVKICILDIVRAVVLSLLASLLLVLLLAVVAKYAPMSDTLATILNQAVKVLAVALGCLMGFRGKRYGLVLGLITGLLFTVLSFALFSLISGKLDFGQITVFDFLLGAAVGIAAGVLAVNVKTLQRKERRSKSPRSIRLLAKRAH